MADVDIVVLGGGPAGYATALRATAHGLSVAVVEAEAVGGTCLHQGCVPSKVLLHSAAVLDDATAAGALGLRITVDGVDLDAVNRHRTSVQSTLHTGLEGLLRHRKVETVQGRGTVAGPRTVEVDGRSLNAAAVVVATGSSVRSLPGVDVDGEVVISSDDAVRLPRIPDRAVVVGAGPVGLEFASLWRSFGAREVTVVEAADRVAPGEDPDVSAELARRFHDRGITCLAGTSVVAVHHNGDEAKVEVETPAGARTLLADTVLMAVGRAPRTAGIGLERLGVLLPSGHVATDRWCRTTHDGLFAAGDVLAPPSLALAHAGFLEGVWIADQVAGRPPAEPIDYDTVPRVTYSNPEVASIGMTEPQARERFGADVRVVRQSLRGNARALAEGADGFAKLVMGPGNALVGAHLVGSRATELIPVAQLARAWEATAEDVAHVVFPHPTVSEVLGEAFLAAAGLPLHGH